MYFWANRTKRKLKSKHRKLLFKLGKKITELREMFKLLLAPL